MKGLLKAMALTIFWIVSAPFRYWDFSLYIFAFILPWLIPTLVWSWNDSGRYAFATEICIVLLALVSVLKFGEWKITNKGEEFDGWTWENQEDEG